MPHPASAHAVQYRTPPGHPGDLPRGERSLSCGRRTNERRGKTGTRAYAVTGSPQARRRDVVKPIIVDSSGNPVRICIFCQSRDNLTTEHVLSKKWRRKHHLGQVGQRIDGWYITADESDPIVRISKLFPKREPFTWTAKVVCNDCNTGWMRRLEEEVEPYLIELVRGNQVILKASELRVLEKWVAKTAFVLEAMDDGAKAMSLDLTRMLMETNPQHASPRASLTWVQAVEKNDHHQLRSSIGTVIRVDHECTGHHLRAATIQIGAVAFLTTYTADPIASDLIATVFSFMPSIRVTGRMAEQWELDRSSPVPLSSVMELHDEVMLRLASAANASPAKPSH